MFKYSPINSYSLRNLKKSQIFFNDPLNFNDTFQPANFKNISNEFLVKFYSKNGNRKFDENLLLGILNKNISREDFINFCNNHIEYFIVFNNKNDNELLKSKEFSYEQLNNTLNKLTKANIKAHLTDLVDKGFLIKMDQKYKHNN